GGGGGGGGGGAGRGGGGGGGRGGGWGGRWSRADVREYLGGAGLGAIILYRETATRGGKGNVAWDHPDNRLVLATGPMAGLPVWGTGALTVVTIGAMTNGPTSTQANGFFGTNLKYCGYAAIHGDYGHVASKNGVGAVMGKKKLKAVAIVKGTGSLKAADYRGTVQAADDIAHDLKTDPSAKSLYEYGTLPGVVNLGKLGA